MQKTTLSAVSGAHRGDRWLMEVTPAWMKESHGLTSVSTSCPKDVPLELGTCAVCLFAPSFPTEV